MRQKKIAAIIAAGGSGSRMKFKTPKPLIKIAGKPIIEYSLDCFEKSKLVDSIVVVAAGCIRHRLEKLVKAKKYKKIKKIVTGGATRAQSVYNGLRAVSEDFDIVAVHDAARPLLKQKCLSRCLKEALKGRNCILAMPVKATIKEINSKNRYIINTPARTCLYEAQTPQVFKIKTLLWAYSKIKNRSPDFKDDASLLEVCGEKVKIVEGSYSNIKITTKEDLKIAEALLCE